jgi:AraC-like DNA-binding protein
MNAGVSRTALAERFHALIGQAPIEYVTSWRMQLAADRMRNGRDSLATIGVRSATIRGAFNRAFKREMCMTPGHGATRPHSSAFQPGDPKDLPDPRLARSG